MVKINDKKHITKDGVLKANPYKKSIMDKLEEIYEQSNQPVVKLNVVWKDGRKTTERLFKGSSGSLAFFLKGSSRRGNVLSRWSVDEQIQSVTPVKHKQTNESDVWYRKMNEIKNRLERSGLWSNVLRNVNDAIDIGYDKIREAYKIYDNVYNENVSNDERQRLRVERIRAVDERLIENNSVRTSIIWEYNTIPKIKKMYFGKGWNDHYLEIIRKALEEKRDERVSATAGYDVSFEYRAKDNNAWYSEEYRGTGNGHYYIALDETHALFVEDD